MLIRYYLTEDSAREREVSQDEFKSAQRRTGFYNNAEFSGYDGDTEIRGRTEYARAANAEPKSRPWELTDDGDYDAYIRSLPTAEAQISMTLRESRLVTSRFPPYSSGASDMIDAWLAELRREWTGGIPAEGGHGD